MFERWGAIAFLELHCSLRLLCVPGKSEASAVPLEPPTGVLHKRKDFLECDEAAKAHPNRTFYYRRNTDLDAVVDSCSKQLLREGILLEG